ncbi:hypothetical protein ACJX0J_015694, partial [Zea mays]
FRCFFASNNYTFDVLNYASLAIYTFLFFFVTIMSDCVIGADVNICTCEGDLGQSAALVVSPANGIGNDFCMNFKAFSDSDDMFYAHIFRKSGDDSEFFEYGAYTGSPAYSLTPVADNNRTTNSIIAMQFDWMHYWNGAYRCMATCLGHEMMQGSASHRREKNTLYSTSVEIFIQQTSMYRHNKMHDQSIIFQAHKTINKSSELAVVTCL